MVGEQSDPARELGTGVTPGSTSKSLNENTKVGDLDRTMNMEATTSTDESPSDEIGKYAIRHLLGQGGMGAVYLGFDPLIEREVAIKLLPSSLSENETALARFLAEARAVGKLNHPNAIAIYDIGQHEGQYYIVMEYARGGSVSALLERKERLPLREAAQIAIDAAQGLQAAHNAGMIHRDIKPENLMLTGEGTVKLVDFGLAKDLARASEMAITVAGQMMGTPFYMSPEQINGGTIRLRTDIYSLGASLYHLLTGEVPFSGDTITQVLFAHVTAPRPDPCKLNPSLPVACVDIVAKAMAIDPAERYASMQEMIVDLEKMLGRTFVSTSAVSESKTIKADQPSARVLIIEPSKLRAKVTADALRKSGCQHIDSFVNPADAILHAQSQPVDVAIASRQLGESTGEDVLRRIRDEAAPAIPMCILVSSDRPDAMLQRAKLEGTAAYVNKQTSLNELLRAVHVGIERDLLQMPLKSNDHGNVQLDVITQDGLIPDEITAWIRELGVLDVTARSRVDFGKGIAHDRNVVVWFVASDSPDAHFPECLSCSTNDAWFEITPDATVVVVEISSDGFRMRGVRRKAFIVACDYLFDRKSFESVISIAE